MTQPKSKRLLTELTGQPRLSLTDPPAATGPYSAATQLNTNENFQAVGYDQVDNLLILCTATAVVTSSTNGTSVSSNKGIPLSGQTNPGLVLGKIVRHQGLWIALLTDQVGLTGAIYTSPAPGAGGTCTWTSRLNMTGGSTGEKGTVLNTDGTQVIAGEYGDPLVTGTPTAHVFRSTDGITWSTVATLTGASMRHIHCVYPDSNGGNVWWMTVGDGPSPDLYKSTDGGQTWTPMAVLDSTKQAVQISDDATNLYLASDSSQRPCDVWVLNKTTLGITVGHIGDHRRIAVHIPGEYTTAYITNGSNVFSDYQVSNFGPHVVGARIICAGVPTGTTITSVTNGSNVVMSANATATSGPIPYQIQGVGEKWMSDPFFGVFDPVNGVYYFTTPGDSTGYTNVRRGLFCVPYFGGPVVLLDAINTAPRNIFVANGYLFCGNMCRPLMTMTPIT